MPWIETIETAPDGTAFTVSTDTDTGEQRRWPCYPDVQPVEYRRRIEARQAVEDWQLLRELHDVLTASGQAYWNTVAPDAGLPSTSGAYTTAMSFLTTRRDKAMSRALAALNRWRLA